MKLIALAVVARCCSGWYVEGVRPNGHSRCVKAPIVLDDNECTRGHACNIPSTPDPAYLIEIYCTGGSVPIVVDDRTIGCQARH